MAVFWCVLSSAWALGKVILLAKECKQAKSQLQDFLSFERLAETESIGYDYESFAKEITFEGVSAEKDGQALLRDVNFCISEGEKVAILATKLCPGED